MLEIIVWLTIILFLLLSFFVGLSIVLSIILIIFQFIVIFLRPFFWIWFKITGNRRIWDTLDSMADRAGYHSNEMLDACANALNSFSEDDDEYMF